MALKASIEARDGVVVLKLSGAYERPEHTAQNEKYVRMVQEKWTDRCQPLRLLIDLREVTGELSRASGYFNISREWGDNRNKRIAWLYCDPRNESQFSYREAVARSFGFVARAFRDEAAAVRWLMEPVAIPKPDGF